MGMCPKRRAMAGAAAAFAAVLMLAGCGVSGGSGGDESPAGDASDASAQQPAPQVRMSPKPGHRVTWRSHPVFVARHGTIASVRLTAKGEPAVTGAFGAGRTRWHVTSRLHPDTAYRAVVLLRGGDGRSVTRTMRFTTAPAAEQLSMSASPGPGATFGVGQTVKVTFNRPVTHRAEVEKHMRVTTSRGAIEGGWHWFSDQEVHFRPRHFWPADTTVTVHVDLKDLYVGDGVWGDRNHDWSWHVGDSHISYVSAATHRFRVTVNGRQVANWPTDLGQPGFETRAGIYNVLMKTPLTEMTSCSIGLSCQEGDATYYDLQVHDDVRLTDTGTFVHAAPWDSELGVANTSHGCIHLSSADAKQFYDMTVPGDVVIVTGTGRAASTTDPGMADWAIPWSQWRN